MIDGQSAAGPDGLVTRLRCSLTVQSLLILLATRLLLFGASWFTLGIIPRLPLYPAQLPDTFFPDTRWLDGWARWDTSHYVTIARFGYGGEGNLIHVGGFGFFPLYPLLMHGIVTLTGLEPTESRLALAAIGIACASSAVAIPVFGHLVNRRFGPEIARTAVILLCVSPFSYFFSAGYSESLFLMLVVLAFAFADRRWWLAAAIVAALATSSRLAGLALPPALLLLAWRRQASVRDLAAITLISPLGAAAFAGYTWRRFNDPFAYFQAQQNWGGWQEHVGDYLVLFTRQPRETLLGDPRNQIILLNVALLVLWLASLPWVWRLLDPGIALFTTLIVIAHGVMTWVSLGRYLLPAIGFYIAAAVLLNRPGWRAWPRDITIAGSTVLLTMLTILFAHGFWTI